jgi:membrane dipeptidase
MEKTQATPPSSVGDVADHIDHIRDVAGIDHIGIGSDFDGLPGMPDGLEDVSKYPALFGELADRGYTDEDLTKIAGQNVLRVMRDAERVSTDIS